MTRRNVLNGPLNITRIDYDHISSSFQISSMGEEGKPFRSMNPQLHSHDFFEFVFILEGELKQRIENSEFQYQKGDVCLLSRQVRHCEMAFSQSCSLLYFDLSSELLRSIFNNDDIYGQGATTPYTGGVIYRFLQTAVDRSESLREYFDIFPTLQYNGNEEIVRLSEAIAWEMRMRRPGNSQIIRGYVARLIWTLEQPENYSVNLRRLDSDTGDFIVSRVMNILQEKHGCVSWEELSTRLNYSTAYVDQVMRKRTSQSVRQLCREFRLDEAKRLLRDTDESIQNIAAQLEYGDASYFYRFFADRVGMPPGQYRKSHRI